MRKFNHWVNGRKSRISLKDRTLTVILKTSGFYIKLCNDWDGRFKHGEKQYALFGFEREGRTLYLDQDTSKPRTRRMDGWVLTIPYVLLYYMSNTHDEITVTVSNETDLPN